MEFGAPATQATKENNCKTPTKKLLTFHGLLAQPSANNYETPPSRISKVKNPFEHIVREHLGTNFISPSLFAKKTPVKKDFTWTIDELSVLKPAEIDENSSNQFESPDRDEYYDSVTQSRIESYFSMQQILPSPMQPLEPVPLIKDDHQLLSHTSDSHSPPYRTTSSYAQTILSLPPILPEEVERVLKPYFTFTQDQQSQPHADCDVYEDSALYKKLFVGVQSPQSEGNEEAAPLSSPVRMIPPEYKHSSFYQRTIGTPGNYDEINLCPLSPIGSPVNVIVKYGEDEEEKEEIGRNSTQMMSIDGSFNVPDCSIVEKHNISQFDSSHHSSEGFSTSAINWDVEYKQMSSPLSTTCAIHLEPMEMSRLNTPKQRPVPSQRKKLSDSFGNDEDFMIISQQSIKAEDPGESGYHTNPSFEQAYQTNSTSSTSTSSTKSASHCPRVEEEVTRTALWESVDVVSSTPTKRKQCYL